MADPLHQFEIQPIVPIEIGGLDLSFSNSAAFMVAAVVCTTLLMVFGMRGRAMVPGRLQSMAEMLYEFVATMVKDNAGPEARKYFPFVFSLFAFILFGNVLGLIPGSFTFTSHIIVTFAMAATVFLFVTLLAIFKHGLHFFSFFVPPGVPPVFYIILVPIEVISYLSRPVSLSVRLFANMLAGHTMLKVFAGFTASMLVALGPVGWVLGILPILVNVALFGLEFLVAVIQAYVFSVLTCLYIRDALELH